MKYWILMGCFLLNFILGILQSQAQDRPGFINRIHRNWYNHNQAYKFLYKKFWAVDSLNTDSKSGKKPEFIAIPFLSYSPESKYKFGLAGVYSSYNHSDSITRGSTQSVRLSYSTQNQAKIEFSPDIWTPFNKTHYTGYFYLENFPSFFYGIGYETQDSNKVLLGSKRIFLNFEVEKELVKNFRVGLTLTLQASNFNFLANQAFFQKFQGLYAQKGGSAYFIGLSFLYDTRDILNFTTRGSLFRLASSLNIRGLSNLNSLSQINFTGIQYFRLSKKTTLGLNLVAASILGNQVPFFLLNPLGGSNIERGYYSGRYRDKNLVEGQLEFKYHFIPRLALGLFAGTGTTWGNLPFSTQEFKPSFGGGIHYIFSIPNQLSLRFDYGFGDKPLGESRSHGAYFSLSEAF